MIILLHNNARSYIVKTTEEVIFKMHAVGNTNLNKAFIIYRDRILEYIHKILGV